MNRNNISFRLILKILSEYRDADSKIPLIFSDFQMVEDVGDNKDKDDGNNDYKKNFSLMRRSIFIISFISCEEKRINIGRINQN
jgi:hypothetical protein